MKKIILAVASVLALGLVVGCKQQIEGSLTVTSLNKSLDQSTIKTYVYSVFGTVTQTTKQVTYQKADKYNSSESTTTTVWTPTKKDVTVTETTDPNNNSITYAITAYGDVTQTTETITKSSKDADPEKSKTVYGKDKNSSFGNFPQSITITKIDNKFYIDNKDGTKKVVEGVDFSAAEIDLSKFSDETSAESVTYYGAVYEDKSAAPTDYISKTTTTTSGYTYDLKLTRK